jgi:hypothetical protein
LDEEQQSAVEGEKKPLPFMTVDGQQWMCLVVFVCETQHISLTAVLPFGYEPIVPCLGLIIFCQHINQFFPSAVGSCLRFVSISRRVKNTPFGLGKQNQRSSRK